MRARSFTRLRSFHRVGGVLIGRDPVDRPDVNGLDLTELRWEADGPTVRLLVVDRAGKVHRSRPFRRDLAELAMAYAADGRPTTVTIINTPSLIGDQRVLLHPALVDTPVGRAAVRADKIIFDLIEREPWYTGPRRDVEGQLALYRHAWAVRLLALEPMGVLTEDGIAMLKGVTSGEDRALMTESIQTSEALGDPARSLLASKSEYYDPTLVAAILAAAGPGRTLDQFDASLRDQARAALGEVTAQSLARRPRRDQALKAEIEAFNLRASAVERNPSAYSQGQITDLSERGESPQHGDRQGQSR